MLTCGACGAALPPEAFNTSQAVPCPECGAPVRVEIFPALLRTPEPAQPGERVLFDTESACFYHPAKKAVTPCDRCGRFLCALCDVTMNELHYCPQCLETAQAARAMEALETRCVRHDDVALVLAVLPLVLCYPVTILTAPAALFYSIRYWKAPTSVVPRSRWRFVAAVFIAVGQLIAWAFVLTALVQASGA